MVLACYGRGALVQAGPVAIHCTLAGRKLRPVCGDRVNWVRRATGGLESIEPRDNVMERIDARGRPEPVAANIDRLAIVVAAEPVPDWFLVDRYWAGARIKDIDTLLVINKQDLGTSGMQGELETYRSLNLPCLEISAHAGFGLEALRVALSGVTLLVGQSGVGKSSLVNALAPEAAAQTAELTRDAEGRHTTTTARWYGLDDTAALIDAPGVRDFAPPASITRAAERGFEEIHAAGVACRFNDCRHFQEPGCAVRAALAAARISPRRYESYRRLARLYEDLAPRH